LDVSKGPLSCSLPCSSGLLALFWGEGARVGVGVEPLGARLPSFTGSSLVCSLVCWLVGRSWAGWLASWFLCGVALDLCLRGSSHPAAPLGRFVGCCLFGRVVGPLVVRRSVAWLSVGCSVVGPCWSVGWPGGWSVGCPVVVGCPSVGCCCVIVSGWAAGRARVVCGVWCVCVFVCVRASRPRVVVCVRLVVCASRPRVVVRALWVAVGPPVFVCVCVCGVCVCSDSLLPLELPGRARSWRSAKQGRRDLLGWGLFGGLCLWVEASV